MTLTEINYYARRFSPFAIMLLLIVLIFVFGIKLFFAYLGNTTETRSPKNNVPYSTVFNKIKPPIIENTKKPNEFQLALDTLDGTPQIKEATSAASIYFIKQETASFGFLSRIYLMAKAAGFDIGITQHKLNGKTAVFDDGKNKLSIDIRTFNYIYNYVVTNDDVGALPKVPSSETALHSAASSYLAELNRYPQELSKGKKNTIYMYFNPETKELTPLNNQEGANIVEIDFFQPDKNGLPVVTSSYYNSQNYVMYLLNQNHNVIKAQIQHFERSDDQVGMYPLRTAQEAWDDLKKGVGYVVSSDDKERGIKIQKVFLAYYDPDIYQEYFQPVYVFLGNNQFVAYVPAVTKEYLEK